MAAPLPTLFVLLCSIAVLLVRCDGLKCKRQVEDKDGVTTWHANTDCASEFHYCFGAECKADNDNKFIWGCTEKDDTNDCETDLNNLFEEEAKSAARDKWACKCIIGAIDKDMDNARFGKGSGPARHAVSGATTVNLSVAATAVVVLRC